uniref:G-protein coupled receptors family 1 profile domain-containing protein n=1 Tax=Meloidogyne incognita TaxID=6306 RepID=A0A914NSF3_MELIC
MEEQSNCHYEGTEYIEVKFILIGVFASGLALISFLLNAFLVLVFALNPKLGRSPLFYFGVLAILDLALAMLYIALMAVPAYMDKFKLLWLYHLFVSYLRPMLTLSNFAVFASVLMILLATTERLLLTFEGKQIKKARKILERNRRQVTLFVISIAFTYKLCTYFEIELIENKDCEGFEQFEVISAVHAYNPNPLFRLFGADKYRFWMMFVIRNLVDHIFPFFILVILNFHIVRALRRESKRVINHQNNFNRNCSQHSNFCSSCLLCNNNIQQNSLILNGYEKENNNASFRSIRESLKNKSWLRNKNKKMININKIEDQTQKKNLRAATRALISVVSMYLMSKVLQVAVTFFETFSPERLTEEEFRPIYSYANDIIPILTLLSSTLRFPIYCVCNKPMLIATR